MAFLASSVADTCKLGRQVGDVTHDPNMMICKGALNDSAASSNGSEKPLLEAMKKGALEDYTEQEYDFASVTVNLNNFPAKLWRLVHNPQVCSVYWDASGLGVIIDQPMFEVEVLGPVNGLKNQDKLFETTNFSSFLRQLNLYGFRKVVACLSDSEIPKEIKVTLIKGSQHCFYSPNFKRGHPELLYNLKRLTTTNKAKIEAGLEVKIRHTNFSQQVKIDGSKAKNNGPVHAGLGHPESLQGNMSSDPSLQNGLLLTNGSDHTSIPQCSLNMSPSKGSFLPSTSSIENCNPCPLTQHMPTWQPMQSVPTAMSVEPGPQTLIPPEIMHNSIPPTLYQLGCYVPGPVQAGPGHPESLQGDASSDPSLQNGTLPKNASDHTSNPQCSWIIGPIDHSLPFTSSMENCIPFSVIPYMPSWPGQSVPAVMPAEPGPQTVASPEMSYNSMPPTLYQPGYYVPGPVQAGPGHPESWRGDESLDPSLQNGPRPANSSDHTSNAQCSWIMGPSDRSLSFTSSMENCIPFPVIPYMPSWPGQSVPAVMPAGPGPQTVAPPEMSCNSMPPTLYQPGYYVPAMYPPGVVIPDMIGYSHQPLSSSYLNYYQLGFPMSFLPPCNQQCQSNEN